MAMTDLTIVSRSLFGRLFSTTTTILTVAVAVALMLVLLTMRDAGRKAFERGSGDMHLLISADSSPLTSVLNGVFYANAPSRAISWGKFQQLANPRFAPWAYAVPTAKGDSFMGFAVVATTPEFFTKFRPNPGEDWAFAEGAVFDANFEVVLGAAAAKGSGLKIGDRLAFTHGTGSSRTRGESVGHTHDEFACTVVGILKPTGGSHDRALFVSLESTWLIHAYDRLEREGTLPAHNHAPEETGTSATAGENHDHDGDGVQDHAPEAHADHAHGAPPIGPEVLTDEDRKITGIYARLATREGSDASAVVPQIFARLRADPTITVAQPAREIENLFKIVGNIDQLFVAMAGVVLVSSGIAIMLALYNSMEQRRRQIAVLRVLGSSRWRVFRLVLAESAVIGLLGALAGVGLALAGGRLAAGILRDQLGLFIDPSLNIPVTLMVTAATIALAALAGLIPALVAYRTPVAKNLRPIG